MHSRNDPVNNLEENFANFLKERNDKACRHDILSLFEHDTSNGDAEDDGKDNDLVATSEGGCKIRFKSF